MHHLPLRAAVHAVLFAGLAAATGGTIALSDFTPRINNLPTLCSTVYNTKIEGCVAADFNPGSTCSPSCLQGLSKIGDSVKHGCSRVDVGETSIIGVFQNDLGIAALCPNNRNAPTTSTTQTTTAAQTSTRVTSTAQTSTATSASSTSTASSSESTAASSGTSSTGSNASTTTLATSTASASPSPTTDGSTNGGTRQLSNPDSGGGSPFDVVAAGSSAHHGSATLGVVAGLLLAVMWA